MDRTAATAIQAVIWDLDGVIIDSSEAHHISWHHLADVKHLPFTDEQFFATFGMRNDEIIPFLWGAMPAEQIQEYADIKEESYREDIRKTARALPGAIELLAALRAAGFKQALASSAPVKNIEVVSEALGLASYLDEMVSGETVPHGKPAPDVFLKAAQVLGIEPTHCVVIEDAVHGVKAAHAGHMKCVSVAGDRDLPGLRAAELMVHDLTQVSVDDIRALGE
jgi:haloacid dehalogenase superfamily, subfamily IA, variant 3 with third motif having DD or ED/haloacid dehalogenase superfamily, subfamily IA, variant 1 with third motif having Dx(3-4)D or Dx(3-4)E